METREQIEKLADLLATVYDNCLEDHETSMIEVARHVAKMMEDREKELMETLIPLIPKNIQDEIAKQLGIKRR